MLLSCSYLMTYVFTTLSIETELLDKLTRQADGLVDSVVRLGGGLKETLDLRVRCLLVDHVVLVGKPRKGRFARDRVSE